jgi:tetratricopeptide (TPR) repeat protein
MKRPFFILIFISTTLVSISQPIPDSLRNKYEAAASALEKGQILANYITALKGTPSEQLKVLLPQLAYFSDKKDEIGLGYTHLYIGILDIKMEDPNEALKHGIAAFKIFGEAQDTFALLKNITLIGNCYLLSGNLEESLRGWKKGLPAARVFDLHYYIRYLTNIAGCFNQKQLPDSALPYIQEALSVGYRNKDSLDISNCLGEMGHTYISMGQNELGRTFLHQALSYLKKINSFYYSYGVFAANILNEISQSFLNSAEYDSSLVYARQALAYKKPEYQSVAATSYDLISKAFDRKNKRDSANEYFRRASEIQSSILSDEKSRDIQNQRFKEELREQEVALQKRELATKRRQNLDYALITLGIISFAIAFLLLSRSFITSERLIRYLGVLALLLAVEFVNLLAHTFLEELTNHSQILVLLLLVAIASLLIPFHHRLEKWTIAKLIEKNRKVRLAAAKHTIEQLEPKAPVAE